MLTDKILKDKESKIKNFPVNANRASMIGHPCLRYLVLQRKEWKQRTPITPRLKLIFELGNVFEAKAIKDLMDAGVEVFNLQTSYKDDALGLTAHVDGLVRDEEGVKRVLEIKSSSPMIFPKINSVEDMINSKYTFMRKYPYQMDSYLMLSGLDEGIWLFVNKSTGEYKEFLQEAGVERQEEISRKCITINEHLAIEELPDCIEYDNNVCGQCDLAHVCNPPRIETDVFLEQDPTLIEALERRDELADTAKEYKDLDRYVKDNLRGLSGILGGYSIKTTESNRKEYTVAATTTKTVKITKL
jgi:hypothetical protein